MISTSGTLLDTTPTTAPTLRIAASDRAGEYFVTLRVTDALGRSDESTALFAVVAGSAKEVDLDTHRPAWVARSVLYGVAPFAFGQGYDDVRKRLPEIAALGVDAIWLSPVRRKMTSVMR